MYSPIKGTGDGTAPVVNLTFPFLAKDHVRAVIGGTATTFTWTGASQITFTDAVPAGIAWEVSRSTPLDALVDFTDGSVLTEDDLDTANLQHIYLAQEISYSASIALGAGARVIDATQAPYSIRGDNTDETSKLQALFDALAPGDIVILPNGVSRISSKLSLFNGSETNRSLVNSVTFILPPPGHPVAFLDPGAGLPKSGYVLEWYGAAGDTMMEVEGPIHGMRVIGAWQLDGRNIAGYGFRGLSFTNFDYDALAAYHCTVADIDLDVRDAAEIGGDANGLTSAFNRIGLLFAYSPEAVGAISLRIDGSEVAGGSDVTNIQLGNVFLGYDADRGKGLWLGYTDFGGIERLVTLAYGTVSGETDPDHSLRPASIYFDGSDAPFPAPAMFKIDWFAPSASAGSEAATAILGGTNGQVDIENFSLNEGAPRPAALNGVMIRRIRSGGISLNHTNPVTLADLMATFGNGQAGDSHIISDASVALSGNAGSIAVGGGSNIVPVYSDGTNWRLG